MLMTLVLVDQACHTKQWDAGVIILHKSQVKVVELNSLRNDLGFVPYPYCTAEKQVAPGYILR